MIEKRAETRVAIHDIIARRWSGRAFDPQRMVEKDTIIALAEAARWSPSCYGDEPWRMIICDRDSSQEHWQSAFDCLAEGNQTWARNAPLLILSVASKRFKSADRDNRWGTYDTGAASMSLCLQATAMGLMCHQMGGFDVDRAMQTFSIPEHYEPMAMIAVGYQLDRDSVPEEMQERELQGRARSNLQENFFAGDWGTGFVSE